MSNAIFKEVIFASNKIVSHRKYVLYFYTISALSKEKTKQKELGSDCLFSPDNFGGKNDIQMDFLAFMLYYQHLGPMTVKVI